MTASGNGWSSHADRDFSARTPQSAEDYEFSQPGKSTKAVIGLGILVAFALVLAFVHLANHGTMSNAPGQVTGPSAPVN